jgi:hypothetical protein
MALSKAVSGTIQSGVALRLPPHCKSLVSEFPLLACGYDISKFSRKWDFVVPQTARMAALQALVYHWPRLPL